MMKNKSLEDILAKFEAAVKSSKKKEKKSEHFDQVDPEYAAALLKEKTRKVLGGSLLEPRKIKKHQLLPRHTAEWMEIAVKGTPEGLKNSLKRGFGDDFDGGFSMAIAMASCLIMSVSHAEDSEGEQLFDEFYKEYLKAMGKDNEDS